MLNISELLRSSGSTIVIAIAVSVFVFIVILLTWTSFFSKNKRRLPRKKTLPVKESKEEAIGGTLIFNKDGSLKTHDEDFAELARQVDEANARMRAEQESSMIVDDDDDFFDDNDDIDLLQEITKDSVAGKIATLEDVPVSTASERDSVFDEEFFEMSKIDDFEDDSLRSKLMNLSPEMKAIVFSNLLDRRDNF